MTALVISGCETMGNTLELDKSRTLHASGVSRNHCHHLPRETSETWSEIFIARVIMYGKGCHNSTPGRPSLSGLVPAVCLCACRLRTGLPPVKPSTTCSAMPRLTSDNHMHSSTFPRFSIVPPATFCQLFRPSPGQTSPEWLQNVMSSNTIAYVNCLESSPYWIKRR